MLVSVIIPCYNVESYIDECVQSVLSQSYRNIELICIDNNSTDQTWYKLLKLKENHPHIILDKENKAGAPAARNKGLMISKGEWIQFLDADDLLLPEKIEHQTQLILSNDQISISFIAATYKKQDKLGDVKDVYDIGSNSILSPFINNCGNTCSNLWSRESLLSIGQWNESLKSSQETDLMFRLILSNKKFLIDELPLTIIRERESGQISQRNPSEKWVQYIDIRLNYMKELKKHHENRYKEIKGIMYDFLMVSIITLWQYDKVKALTYFDTIKHDWVSSYSFGFNRFKVMFIKWLGLKIFMILK